MRTHIINILLVLSCIELSKAQEMGGMVIKE